MFCLRSYSICIYNWQLIVPIVWKLQKDDFRYRESTYFGRYYRTLKSLHLRNDRFEDDLAWKVLLRSVFYFTCPYVCKMRLFYETPQFKVMVTVVKMLTKTKFVYHYSRRSLHAKIHLSFQDEVLTAWST